MQIRIGTADPLTCEALSAVLGLPVSRIVRGTIREATRTQPEERGVLVVLNAADTDVTAGVRATLTRLFGAGQIVAEVR